MSSLIMRLDILKVLFFGYGHDLNLFSVFLKLFIIIRVKIVGWYTLLSMQISIGVDKTIRE